jgi:hypothetical protein
MKIAPWLVLGSVALLAAGQSSAQLRVASWNVTNYSGGRVSEFQTAIYGVFEGRSMAPDVFVGQEFLSAAGVAAFKALLNSAPGSPGDWEAAPFIDGPDTDSAFFYRTSRVQFLGQTIVSVGGPAPQPPRHTMRYDVIPVGYSDEASACSLYSVHMKSGTASADSARRLLEAQRIRDNAQALPARRQFMMCGDTNIQSSSSTPYVELVGSQTDNRGRFFDPINTPGTWNNNRAFRFVHTQDPAVQMDDRHDQIIVSAGLIDGDGLDYIGNPLIPYSTTTWNDPNHSYRSWGNDGSTFDQIMRTTGNAMVGEAIATALVASANGLGHLPVFLDLRVAPEVGAPAIIDFGDVAFGSFAARTLTVSNAADVSKWGLGGIAGLGYSLSTTGPFAVPAGPFAAPAGGSNNHTVTLDTATPGFFESALLILSNSPDEPQRTVVLRARVLVPPCPADFNHDGYLDFFDFDDFVAAFESGDPAADFNTDGYVDFFDFDDFVTAFEAGC